jgi:hypothetical protein
VSREASGIKSGVEKRCNRRPVAGPHTSIFASKRPGKSGLGFATVDIDALPGDRRGPISTWERHQIGDLGRIDFAPMG